MRYVHLLCRQMHALPRPLGLRGGRWGRVKRSGCGKLTKCRFPAANDETANSVYANKVTRCNGSGCAGPAEPEVQA
jgi:hypothetical protein